jgi:formate hydrogenlyase transcriptional activator
MKKKLSLLGELIETCHGIKSKEIFTRKIASFMYDNFKSTSVEMAWGIGSSTRVISVTRNDNEYDLRVTDRDINQSAFSEVLASGQALVSEVQDNITEGLFLEERKAVELYASQLLILPLYDGDDINGFVGLYLLEQQDLAGLSELLQHSLSFMTLILKQCDLTEKLTSLSRKAFKTSRQMRENLEDIVWKGEGESAGITRRELLMDCRLASQCTTGVYITGEQGTDKEETARHIHKLRTFDLEPFITFNCANAPISNQLELLFGSYASQGKKGSLDKCQEGTLYITNGENLTPESQELLVELMNDKSGDYNCQIIVSGELDKSVNSGDFDDELYEAVSEMTVEIPALRNSREDLAMICKKYCKELSTKMKLPMPKLSRKFLQSILAASWKGNHEELKGFLEKSMICSTSKELQIPEGFTENDGLPVIRSAESLDESIKRNIIDALKKARGKVYGDNGAAVILGLNPSTLQSKMRKLGIKKKVSRY